MARISRGYSFQPYFNRIVKLEIQNIVLKKLGRPTINIKNSVLGHGIAHLLGVKPEIVPRDGADKSEPPEDIKKTLRLS